MAKKMMNPNDFETEVQIGEITVERPKPPPKKDILNSDKPVHNQKWRPNKLTDQEFDDLTEQQQRDYLIREFKRFKEGLFFYNNGNIEWLTGDHYFYLTYWEIDSGLPDFRDADRDFFQAWNQTVNDPNCYGLLYVTDRGSGKTYKGTAITYLATTLNRRARSGIQSKTGSDSKSIFNSIVLSWRNLPNYIKPLDAGISNPKSSLNFEEPTKVNKKGKRVKEKNALDSYIDFKPSDDTAYDGATLLRLYQDEIGKPSKETDIYNRWYVCKKSVFRQGIKKGNAFLSSTIEDMGKHGITKVKQLWDESDPNKKNKNGSTISGLFRLFKPADYGNARFIDEYGYSDRESATEYIMNEREMLSGKSLTDEQRKAPLYVSEAFKQNSNESPFPTWKIEEQLDYNATIVNAKVRVGNFIEVEKDGFKTVEFRDDKENGRFKIISMPNSEERNSVDTSRGALRPRNAHKYCAGIDPIAKTTPGGSNAAMYVFKKYDALDPYNSHYFCCEYIARPPKVEIFFEDVIKCLTFYGCQALVENNVIGLINYMRQKGYEGLLMERPDNTKTSRTTNKRDIGIPMNGEAVWNNLMEVTESYIYDRVGRIQLNEGDEERFGICYFDALLNDWLAFDPQNHTPHDETVAAGLALMAAQKRKTTHKAKVKTKKKDLFPTFNIKGNKSTKIN